MERDGPSSYHYTPLPGRHHARLVRVVSTTPLALKCFVVDLKNVPAYLALSYTWGSSSSCVPASVDHLKFSIMQNLADAITHIQPYLEAKNLLLWADFICINQSDTEERGHQVQIMRAIYQSAQVVGIWLGASYDDSDLIMATLVDWKREFETISESLSTGHDWFLTVSSLSALNFTAYDHTSCASQNAWKAFAKLIQRAWWTRAWVVQEATALEASKTLIFCGSKMVDWLSLRVALITSHRGMELTPVEMRDAHGASPSAMLLDSFRMEMESGAHVRLLTALELMRCFWCGDPRDKLYACLGLVTDVSEQDITPDYNKSIEEVYTDIARFSIKHSAEYGLDFLGLVIHLPVSLAYVTASGLPSWVPDMHQNISASAFEIYLDSDDIRSPRAYNASKDISGRVRIDSGHLYVYGFVVDRINETFPACYQNLSHGGLHIEHNWRPTAEHEKYVCGGTVMEAFDHTILADIGRSGVKKSGLTRGAKMDWDMYQQNLEELAPHQVEARHLMCIDVKRTTFGRRLVKTATGFLGLAPGVAEIGDLVCLLFGGHVLYILRAQDGEENYTYVGECYLHGMMDGQALASDYTEREFVVV